MEENKIAKAGIGYTIGNYLLKGLTFFTIPIFSRLMNAGEYGLYNTFIAYEGILYVLIGIAFNSSYRSAWYRYKGNEEGKDYYAYVSTTIVVVIISALIWFVLFHAIGDWLAYILKLEPNILILLVIYSSAMAVMSCFSAHVSLQYEYKKFIKVSGANAIFNIGISLILICTVFTENRYLGRMLGTTIPAALTAIYIIVYFFKIAKPGNYKEFLSWGLRYSIPIVPYGIGLVLLGQFDRIMINKMVGTVAVGIYSFAYNIFALVNVTSISLDNVWSPWIYEKMNLKEYQTIRQQGNKYIFLMLLFSSLIILISPELVMILGTSEYLDASYCVIPIVAGGYFSFLSTLPISVEYFYEKTKLIAVGTIVAGLVNIVLNLFFINKFGYVAAAYTTLATYILYFIVHYCVIIKIHGIELFDSENILFCCFLILLVAVVARLFIHIWFIRWLIAIGYGIIFIVLEEREFGYLKKLFQRLNI